MPSKSKVLGNGLENRLVDHAHAHNLPATKQPLSGVLAAYPNDVVVATTLCECKVRDGGAEKSIRVEYAWLDKVRANATRLGFDRGVVVVNPKGSRKPMALLDLDDLLKLLSVALDTSK